LLKIRHWGIWVLCASENGRDQMRKSKLALRFGGCGALGAVYLGLAASAMAWTEPLWVRQLGTKDYDVASGVATDAAGNVYLTGNTEGSLGGPNRGEADAWVAKYDAAGHALWVRIRNGGVRLRFRRGDRRRG
jgi:hypothetical protein